MQVGDEAARIDLLCHLDGDGLTIEFLRVGHFFCQCLRVGYDQESMRSIFFLLRRCGVGADGTDGFGTEDFVGSIGLSITDRPFVARWKKQHTGFSPHLTQVMIKISGAFYVIEHKQIDVRGR